MVKFRQLHLYFLSLEEVILCLLTHWRDQIKLPRHRISLLVMEEKADETENRWSL